MGGNDMHKPLLDGKLSVVTAGISPEGSIATKLKIFPNLLFTGP